MTIHPIRHEIAPSNSYHEDSRHLFQKLPKEIFFRIISFLSIADLQSITYLDKWMFTLVLNTDLPTVVKEILFSYQRKDVTKEMLSAHTRGYFKLSKAPIFCMKIDQIAKLYDQCLNKLKEHSIRALSDNECILLCKSKSTYLIQQLLSSERFQQLPSAVVTDIFHTIAINGPMNTFRAIIRSQRFSDIDSRCLCEVFSFGSSQTQREIIQTLMLSPRFAEISIDSISIALLQASIQGDADIIFHLLSSPRFKHVPIDMLGHAMQLSCKYAHYDALKTILASTFSDNIPYDNITASYIEAEKSENEVILDMLLNRYPLLQIEGGCVLC